MTSLRALFAACAALFLAACAGPQLRGTGDLGLVIERATGQVTLVNTSSRQAYARIMASEISRTPRSSIPATVVTPSSSAAMAG